MNDIDTLVGRLAPVTDARAAELCSEEAAADLAERIMSSSASTAGIAAPRRSRRLTVGLPLLATGLAGAAAATALVATSGGSPAPSPSTRAPAVKLAAALDFTRKGDHLDVRILDPYADPQRYKAEFAKHGLRVTLSLVPVSPSMVGTVVMQDTSEGTRPGDITDIRVKGACQVPSGGDDCTVGVRVRIGYKGTAGVVFGRAARPGEHYTSTGNVDARGEVMHGMAFRGRRVTQVLAALAKRHVTVPEYRYTVGNETKVGRPGQIPGGWYVHDAVPWAAGQVLLFVGPHPTERPGDGAPPNTPANTPPGAPAVAPPSSPPSSVAPSVTPTG
jgi:hypothetical protein